LDGLRLIHQRHQPMFASCWGFQALARALGGQVRNDRRRAEVGTHPLQLTDAGRADPLFGRLPDPFIAQMGHEDHVITLPPGAVHLAASENVPHQAYTFADRPIYATQFHAELSADDLRKRIRSYPEYLKLLTGLTFEEFCEQTQETPECAQLAPRFLSLLETGALPG
jgi:GMP synthase (glutamine-hydrolysing)